MHLHPELSVFLSPESTPIHKRQTSGIGNLANNNRSRLPFIIAFAVGVPIVLALAFGTWYYRTRQRRAFFAGNRQPPSRGNRSWGKRKIRNNRGSAPATTEAMVEPPPPVYTGIAAPGANNPNVNKDVPGVGPGLNTPLSPQAGGSSSDAPPSYVDATASDMEEGRTRS